MELVFPLKSNSYFALILFFLAISGCQQVDRLQSQSSALQACQNWRDKGRKLSIELKSFHSSTADYPLIVYSRECRLKADQKVVFGLLYESIENGQLEAKSIDAPFRTFLEVNRAKGKASIEQSFGYF